LGGAIEEHAVGMQEWETQGVVPPYIRLWERTKARRRQRTMERRGRQENHHRSMDTRRDAPGQMTLGDVLSGMRKGDA
jgi:hypothetical protein